MVPEVEPAVFEGELIRDAALKIDRAINGTASELLHFEEIKLLRRGRISRVCV